MCPVFPRSHMAPLHGGQEGEARELCSTAKRSSSAPTELSCIHLRCNPILLPDGLGVTGSSAGRHLQSRERAAGAAQFVTHLPSSSRPQNHARNLPVQIPALQSQPDAGEHRCADGSARSAPRDSIPPSKHTAVPTVRSSLAELQDLPFQSGSRRAGRWWWWWGGGGIWE